MKKLDKYIAKNFLVGYAIAFCVLIGMRILIDVFVNLDEFTENLGKITDSGQWTTMDVIKYIFTFYLLNSMVYFRDFAGMITVVAAAFSFGKMIRSNELIAIMASGVSLKRTIVPIILLAMILTAVLVVDQELLIPMFADKLVRSHDDIPGQETYDVMFITDENGSLIFSQKFDVETSTLYHPTILIRNATSVPGIWQVEARIDADKAILDNQTGRWELYTSDPANQNSDLHYGIRIERDPEKPIQKIDSYLSDITAKQIPIRSQAENKSLMSFMQLNELASLGTTRDKAQLYSQKHFRVTEPIISLAMLMISLPILVCRDPKTMKSAVMLSFALTSLCFLITFICKMLATEQVIFDKVVPELWAWLPVFIFPPVAFIEWDSMKT